MKKVLGAFVAGAAVDKMLNFYVIIAVGLFLWLMFKVFRFMVLK